MRKIIAITLLFSFLFAVNAEGEEREVEVLTGPKIEDREEVIFYSSGEKEERKPEDSDSDVNKKAEEAEGALARVKARAEAEKAKERVSFISSSSKLTPEEQEEAVKLILQVVLVAGIILLAKIVKTEKTE